MRGAGVDMPVGHPVHQVEHDEDGRREPHRPGVDVVCQRLLVGAQPFALIKDIEITSDSSKLMKITKKQNHELI